MRSLGIKVKKDLAEEVHRIILRKKIIRRELKPKRINGFIVFPIKEEIKIEGTEIVYEEFEERNKPNPRREIEKRLHKELPKWVAERVKPYWDPLGEFALIKLPEGIEEYYEKIGKIFAEVLGKKGVFLDMGVSGELRVPKVRLIYGSGGTTRHKENGVIYVLDPEKVMFSSGNVDERTRMARINMEGEVVADMFAGIGYFSLQVAVHSRPRLVYAAEKNETAYKFLLEGIRENGVEDRVVPLLGDCRRVMPEGIADRVIMGYLHKTEMFLGKAFRILREGGIIHFHYLVREEKGEEEAIDAFSLEAKKWGMKFEVENVKYVKSYAPMIWHVVLDVNVWRGKRWAYTQKCLKLGLRERGT